MSDFPSGCYSGFCFFDSNCDSVCRECDQASGGHCGGFPSICWCDQWHFRQFRKKCTVALYYWISYLQLVKTNFPNQALLYYWLRIGLDWYVHRFKVLVLFAWQLGSAKKGWNSRQFNEHNFIVGNLFRRNIKTTSIIFATLQLMYATSKVSFSALFLQIAWSCSSKHACMYWHCQLYGINIKRVYLFILRSSSRQLTNCVDHEIRTLLKDNGSVASCE